MLTGVKQTLNAMKGNQVISEESARGFNRALEMLDTSIGELRRVARNMMPEALLKFGLNDAIRDMCDAINDVGQVRVQYQSFGLQDRLAESREVILFRIVQELLNNAIKHAHASQIIVQLLRDENRVHLTVEDNGHGFDIQKLQTAPGIGWLNIKSRVDYLGGTLQLKSEPGKGTAVEVEFSA
jgi:signal transduction histidine kinase